MCLTTQNTEIKSFLFLQLRCHSIYVRFLSQNNEENKTQQKCKGNVYERERERDLERLGEADRLLFGDLEGDLDFFGEYDRRGLREREWDFFLGDLLRERDRLRLRDPRPPPGLSCFTRMNATSP